METISYATRDTSIYFGEKTLNCTIQTIQWYTILITGIILVFGLLEDGCHLEYLQYYSTMESRKEILHDVMSFHKFLSMSNVYRQKNGCLIFTS